MPNNRIKSLTVNGVTYDIVDQTSGFITTETDPTVPAWAKASSKPSYTFSELTSHPTTLSGYGITDAKIASGTITLGANTITPLTSFTETDPVFSSSAAAEITSTDISNWNSKTSNTGTVTNIATGNGLSGGPITTTGTISLKTAKTSKLESGLGGVQVWKNWENNSTITPPSNIGSYSGTITIQNESTNSDRYYAIEATYDGHLIVNIPWTGTVTSVGLSNATDGGLTISGSPITTSGSITVGHTNILSSAQTTQALYPIKIDKNGHISAYGTAVTSLPASDVSAWAKAANKPSYNFSEIGSTPTSLSGYGITNAYTKTEVDGLVAGVLHYKGTKATVSALPSTGNVIGDTWHVTADGSEWAWDGTEWQELGTAVDLSSYALLTDVPTTASNSTTGISIADHGTTSIYGVGSTTTSVIGVQSSTTSVRGVKTGTSSTTTASHVKSGGNGTAPTLGTAISIYGVKSGTNSTTTASKASGGNGTAPTLGTAISLTGVSSSTTSVRGVKTGDNSTTTASKVTLGTAISVPNVTGNTDVTVPIRADADTTVPTAASSATTVPIKDTSATTVPIKNTSATSVPVVSSNNDATLNFTMDTTDTKKLVIAWSATPTRTVFGTAASIYGVQSTTTSVTGVQSSTTSVTGVSGSTTVRGVKTGDSSTTTASKVTLGTAKSIPNVTAATDVTVPIRADADTTVPIKNTNATSIPNVTSVGSASTWSFTDVTVPIRADSATSIPNVTSVGTAANWVFEDITVPIRADADTTVPIKDASATTVPIKDGTATTVVTGKTHSITDNGHTHSLATS